MYKDINMTMLNFVSEKQFRRHINNIFCMHDGAFSIQPRPDETIFLSEIPIE